MARLNELRAVLDATFDKDVARLAQGEARPWTAWDSHWSAQSDIDALTPDLGAEKTVDRLLLQEAIEEGQRVERFVLEGWHEGQWKEIVRGGCIGYKRWSVSAALQPARSPAHRGVARTCSATAYRALLRTLSARYV